MRRLRISVAGLMGLVVLAAVLLFALIHPTRFVANAVFSLSLALNTAAVIAFISSRSGDRSIWGGAAIAGWTYLVLSLAPGLEGRIGPFLVTTPLIDLIYEQMETKDKPKFYLVTYSNGTTRTAGSFPFPPNKVAWDAWNVNEMPFDIGGMEHGFIPNSSYSFYRISHSIFSIICGLAGALFARWLRRASVSPSLPPGVNDPTTSTPHDQP